MNMRSLLISLLCFSSFLLDASFDVVIVSHYKDYETLPLCIASIKKYIPDCARIFVIGNREITHEDFTFVHENAFYNYINPQNMERIWQKHNAKIKRRAFWIFQQFLKLGAPLLIEDLSENYLCIDSDIVWTRPQQFINENGQYLYSKQQACCCCGKEGHRDYVRMCRKLLGNRCRGIASFSFIAHHMMFNRTIVKEMLGHIEMLHDKPWYEAIFANLNLNEISNFSEYELYGNWVWNNYPELLAHRQITWVSGNDLDKIPEYAEYDFVSSQYYDRHAHDMGWPVA